MIKSGLLHDQKLAFTSFSNDLKNFEHKIKNVLKHKVVYKILTKESEIRTKLEKVEKNFENQDETKHFILDGENKFYFQNPIPSFLSMSNEIHSTFFSESFWMLDCKIHYRPEKFTYTNLDYYWKLPHITGVTRTFFRNFYGRVNGKNYISILVGSKVKNIELTIPIDLNFLWAVFVEGKKYLQQDIRKPIPKEISEIRISDKGIYALSFLERFPNNWEASRFVETKFWRVLFEQMNKIDEIETKKKLVPIKNRLSRILNSSSSLDIDWLSDFILKKSRELRTKIEFISYNELLSRFHRERENVIKESEQPNGYSHDDVEEKEELNYAINELLEYSILFQGINPKCVNCGSKNWYSTEEIKDVLVCKGCMTKFRLKAEEPWSYKLNTLVANAISYHGVIPVIWAQNYLLNRCESFISIPGVKFYQENSSEPSEIDLVAIKDGNLLLAELKTKSEEFGKPDLENFASICKIIKPQKAILGSINGGENKLKQKGKELEKLINHSEIEVKTIYPDEYFFESSWLL